MEQLKHSVRLRLFEGFARCPGLHSKYMLNRGYAYTTIISSKYHGQTLLSHLASLYPHSTQQAWQQNLNNGEVTLDHNTITNVLCGATSPATGNQTGTVSGAKLPTTSTPWYNLLFAGLALMAMGVVGFIATRTHA